MNAAVGASGEIPNQEAINCAGKQVAGFGLRVRSGNLVQNPANFQTAEVSGKRKAGFPAIAILSAIGCEFGDHRRDACVLPDYCVVNSCGGLLIPDDCGLALVGDADPGEIAWAEASSFHGCMNDALGSPPDFRGIMFDPAGLGKIGRASCRERVWIAEV